MNCKCSNTARRQLLCSNGTTQIKLQCLDCGRHSQAVKKQPGDEKLPFVDKDLWKKIRDNEDREIIKQAAFEKEKKMQEYKKYLSSFEWAAIRERVLARDQQICQGCLLRNASQVHHLTYDNIFDELCFQLVSLCSECHAKVHKKVVLADANT